jgi:hypothetical protein
MLFTSFIILSSYQVTGVSGLVCYSREAPGTMLTVNNKELKRDKFSEKVANAFCSSNLFTLTNEKKPLETYFWTPILLLTQVRRCSQTLRLIEERRRE